MADSTSVQDASHQDLTDDQIQQLLLEAETRLRGSAVTQVDDPASIRIPKLATGSSLEAYVRQEDDVAAVNAAKITDPKQKELANSLHAAGKKETKVSSTQFLSYPFYLAMRKIFPTRSA
jgi:hypothetical protein